MFGTPEEVHWGVGAEWVESGSTGAGHVSSWWRHRRSLVFCCLVMTWVVECKKTNLRVEAILLDDLPARTLRSGAFRVIVPVLDWWPSRSTIRVHEVSLKTNFKSCPNVCEWTTSPATSTMSPRAF